MSLIDRDRVVRDVIDRIDTLERQVRGLQEYSSTPPTAGTVPEQPNWSEISGWVMTGTTFQDINGRIILDAETPKIQIAASGYIQSADFVANTSGFQINGGTAEFNDVVVRGTIYATVGEIGGWAIAATSLSNNDATLSSTGYLLLGTGNDMVRLDAQDATYRIWAGNAVAASAPFSVTKAGAIAATSGAVGGWTLGAASLTGGDAILHNTGYLLLGTGNDIVRADAVDATYRLWIGHATAGSAPFRVTKAGVMTATSGTLGSLDISGVITVGSGAPYIEVDGSNKRIRTSNYVADTTGFTIELDGSAEFSNIRVRGSIQASVFQKSLITAFAGSQLITKSAGKLTSDYTVGGNMVVEDPPGAGGWLFATNDRVRIKQDTGSAINETWVIVTQGAPTNTYTTSYQSGNNGITYQAGNTVVDYGQSGDGGLYLTADATNAPYLQIFTHAGSPWSAITERVRIGNLNGWGGYGSDLYGIAVGDWSGNKYMTYDPTNGLRVRGVIRADSGYLDTLDVQGTLTIQTGGEMVAGHTRIEEDGIEIDVSPANGWLTDPTYSLAFPSSGTDYGLIYTENSVGNIRLTLETVATGASYYSAIFLKANGTDDNELRLFGGETGLAAYTTLSSPLRLSHGLHVGSLLTAPYDNDIALDGGLHVNVAGDPAAGEIRTAGAIRVGTGLHVGATTTTPTDNDITLDGGIHVNLAGNPAVGEIWCSGDIRVGIGLYVGGTGTDPDDNDIHFDGNLKSMKNSTFYDVYGYVPLDSPLTATEFDGDPFSTTAKTLVNTLQSKFGLPANVKAISVAVRLRDNGSAANNCWLILSPNNTAGQGVSFGCSGLPSDYRSREHGIINCNVNGDIYYQCNASGAGTLDIWIEIHGYWI